MKVQDAGELKRDLFVDLKDLMELWGALEIESVVLGGNIRFHHLLFLDPELAPFRRNSELYLSSGCPNL